MQDTKISFASLKKLDKHSYIYLVIPFLTSFLLEDRRKYCMIFQMKKIKYIQAKTSFISLYHFLKIINTIILEALYVQCRQYNPSIKTQ